MDEEEDGDVDWFYSRPAPELENEFEDQNDEAVH